MKNNGLLTFVCILAGLTIFTVFGPYAWIILLLSLVVLLCRNHAR